MHEPESPNPHECVIAEQRKELGALKASKYYTFIVCEVYSFIGEWCYAEQRPVNPKTPYRRCGMGHNLAPQARTALLEFHKEKLREAWRRIPNADVGEVKALFKQTFDLPCLKQKLVEKCGSIKKVLQQLERALVFAVSPSPEGDSLVTREFKTARELARYTFQLAVHRNTLENPLGSSASHIVFG